MYSLFLDDERHPKDVIWVEMPLVSWVIVRDFKEFTQTIERQGLPKIVSFDHDLNPSAYAHYIETCRTGKIDYSKIKGETGIDCAKWLVAYCFAYKLPFPDFLVHSHNDVGALNLKNYLKKATNKDPLQPIFGDLTNIQIRIG